MSETNKSKKIPNNTTNYIVFGKEKDLEISVTGENHQDAVHIVPGIPMEISVEPHSFAIDKDGTIIRKDKNGNKLPGKVTDKKVINAVKGRQEAER